MSYFPYLKRKNPFAVRRTYPYKPKERPEFKEGFLKLSEGGYLLLTGGGKIKLYDRR